MTPGNIRAEFHGWPLHEILACIDQESPSLRALCCPKHFSIPRGFSSPEVFMLSAYTAARTAQRGLQPSQDVTIASLRLTAAQLIRYQVPTYFVAADFCEALIHTEAPDDLRFDEIQFPMPAMLFMLPTDFSLRYFGCLVPFLTVTSVPARCVAGSPIRIGGWQMPPLTVANPQPLFIAAMLAWEAGRPMHYDSRTPIPDTQVKDLLAADIELFSSVGWSDTIHEQDKRTVNRLAHLSINILLGMTAEPELVTRERILRAAKKKNGKVVRRATWKPNFIGEHFRITYENPAPIGTHRSPHAHWRRGHWRNQRHGPQLLLIKRIWIRPVFVGLGAAVPKAKNGSISGAVGRPAHDPSGLVRERSASETPFPPPQIPVVSA
ncbi:MAG TPA: hypothetical protein VGW37_11570 [Terriglobia bacterium]|nr:hypothetical protein [Terriglobia bacterium]